MSKPESMSLRETAARLIAVDTVSSNSNTAAVEFIADYLDAAGMNVVIQKDLVDGVWKANLLASMGPPTADGLLISGHIDVVPFSDQAGWTTDPLVLHVGDERVYGRGTSDMKVFIAHCLCAAIQLDARTLRRPLVYAFTYDEEVGCGGAKRLAPEMARLLGDMPLPRICWIGEPTSGRIFHAQKGSVIFQIRVIGRTAHSGTPEAGTNAVVAMSRLLGRIDRYASELAARPRGPYLELFPGSAFPTINIASVNGGGTVNSVPDCCLAEVYYRPLPGEDPLEVYEEIQRRILSEPLRPHGPSAGAAEVMLGPPSIAPGVLSNRNPALEGALSAAMGTKGSTGAPFATDACMLCAAGIDCFICGPGELGEAHRANESMSRSAFERGHQDIISVVHKVCRSAS